MDAIKIRTSKIRCHGGTSRGLYISLPAVWVKYSAPGRYCDINSCLADLENGGSIYSIFEQCRLIERRPDGRWLTVIEMSNVLGEQWSKDGTRVLLDEDNIWEPMRLPYERRNETYSEGYL